jgi:hypothetical protein
MVLCPVVVDRRSRVAGDHGVMPFDACVWLIVVLLCSIMCMLLDAVVVVVVVVVAFL